MPAAQSVKLPSTLVEELREAAELHSRSMAGQAEHWMRLGRLVEIDPRFGVVAVEQALRGKLSPDALQGPQQEAYLDALAVSHWDEDSLEEQAFFAKLAAEGGMVGYPSDDASSIVSTPKARKRSRS